MKSFVLLMKLSAGLVFLGSCGQVVSQFKLGAQTGCHLTNGCVALIWDPTPSDLGNDGGYELHWGPSSGNYTHSKDVGNVLTAQIDGLASGTHYFVVTAYANRSTNKISSEPSNELSVTAQAPSSSLDHGFPLVPTLPYRRELKIVVP